LYSEIVAVVLRNIKNTETAALCTENAGFPNTTPSVTQGNRRAIKD